MPATACPSTLSSPTLTQPEPPPFAQPPFAEPWQAEAFALAVTLHARGLFTWPEWAQALGARISAAAGTAGEADYHTHWLEALESIVVAKGAASAAGLGEMAKAWKDAAEATPHGEPIALEAGMRRG